MFNPMMKPMWMDPPVDRGNHGPTPTVGYGGAGGAGYADGGKVQESDEYLYFVVLHCSLVVFSLASSFYIVVAGLMCFTALKTIIQAVFIVPQYITGANPFSAGYRKTMFTLDMLADYGILGFSTLMAANRYSTFQLGCSCPVFAKPVIYYLLGLVSAIIAICVALLSGMGCTKEFSHPTNSYVDMCPNATVFVVIEKSLMFLYYAVCLLSAYFYLKTYHLIRNQRGYLMKNESSRCGPEMVILKQAIIIFSLYVGMLALSTIMPFLCSSSSASLFFYLNYFLNMISLFISAAFPGLFLAGSNEFRREIGSWLSLCGLHPHWLTRAKRITSATTITSRERGTSFSK